MRTGEALRDEALSRVVQPTGNRFEELMDFARPIVTRMRRGEYISSANISAYWVDSGRELPAEPRVLGAVMRQLKAAGLLTPAHFTKHPSASRHAAPMRLWRRV